MHLRYLIEVFYTSFVLKIKMFNSELRKKYSILVFNPNELNLVFETSSIKSLRKVSRYVFDKN